jgi:uncharacterized protein (TIRG00374 family)
MIDRRRIAMLTVGIASSALFLWLALRGVDVGSIGQSLRHANPAWALPYLLGLFAFCWLKAVRWSTLLMAPRTSIRPLLWSIFIGYAATTLLPLQLGEVVRAWAASRLLALRVATALASIAVERVIDVLTLLLWLGAALAAGARLSEGLARAGYTLLIAGIVLLVMLIVFALRDRQILALIARVTAPLPASWRARLLDQLSAGADGLKALRTRSAWVFAFGISPLLWAFMCVCIWSSLRAVGLDLPLAATATILGLTMISMSLPSGPGYVGNIQLAFTLALAPFDVAPGDALAASIFYHVMMCGTLLIVGLAGMHRLGLGVRGTLARRDSLQPGRD